MPPSPKHEERGGGDSQADPAAWNCDVRNPAATAAGASTIGFSRHWSKILVI